MPVAAGTKIVYDQGDHLGEVQHCRFPAVTLPVCVGGETDRGVEREVRAQGAEALGIERQPLLQPQNPISEQATHQAEEQHGSRIFLPILLLAGADSHRPISDPLQRLEERVKPGPARGIQDLDQVEPHRFSDQRHGRHIHPEL